MSISGEMTISKNFFLCLMCLFVAKKHKRENHEYFRRYDDF
jgi:hypothetical protein